MESHSLPVPASTGSGQAAPTLIRPASRPKMQVDIDLAVTVDRTGSSDRFRTGIPITLEAIVTQIEGKARSVRCWLQSHGDQDDGQFPLLHTDGGTPNQAVDDCKRITYGGGGDAEEHHLDGIEHLLNTVPWSSDRSRSRGAILALLTEESKPLTSGKTAQQLGMEIKSRGILLYLICEPRPMLRELVNTAEGLMFQISNNPDLAELQRIASQLAASVIATVGSGSTKPIATLF
jgi:hypothetical protein